MRGYESHSGLHHRMRAGHYVQRHRPEVPDHALRRVNASHMTRAARPDEVDIPPLTERALAPAPSTAKELLAEHMKATDARAALLARREAYSKNRGDEDIPPSPELAAAHARVSPIFDEIQSVPPAPLNGQPARDWCTKVIDELRDKFPGGPHDDIPVRTLLDMS